MYASIAFACVTLNMIMGSFAAGKGSALVIDIGQSTASVTPVVDGFVLRKGLYLCVPPTARGTHPLLGLAHCALPQLVHAHAKHLLTSPSPTRLGTQLIPHPLIASRTVRSLSCSLPFISRAKLIDYSLS